MHKAHMHSTVTIGYTMHYSSYVPRLSPSQTHVEVLTIAPVEHIRWWSTKSCALVCTRLSLTCAPITYQTKKCAEIC